MMNELQRIKHVLENMDLRPSERIYLFRLFRHVHVFFKPGAKVLDAGCGDAKPAEVLAKLGCKVIGVDIEAHPERWKELQAMGVQCQQASAEKLPFPDASFDAVWIKDAFHHMEDPKQAMAELQRVTKPGGPIVVVEANRYNPVFYLHLTLFGNHQHFTRRALRAFLRTADPDYFYVQAESRCLPWDAPWLLALLVVFEEFLERAKVFNPWLTYQIAKVKGKGTRPK